MVFTGIIELNIQKHIVDHRMQPEKIGCSGESIYMCMFVRKEEHYDEHGFTIFANA